MSQAMQTGQGGSILPSAPTTQDLASLLVELGNNPAFVKAQARGTIKERAYVMRASIACGSMEKGAALVEMLAMHGHTITLNGTYDTTGSFTPWNVLACLPL